mgnify:CR=1 FL=1
MSCGWKGYCGVENCEKEKCPWGASIKGLMISSRLPEAKWNLTVLKPAEDDRTSFDRLRDIGNNIQEFVYKENGFKEKETAEKLIAHLREEPAGAGCVESIERKKENKNPPLLYNLAELQNDCSKLFKISPDETLRIVQELYERKMVTYPRTDARVLSTAVAKEIHKNIGGLKNYAPAGNFAAEILSQGSYKNIAKTRYVNDKQITDHYAIIPTGQGLGALNSLPELSRSVYDKIVRRFLAVFYPPAEYRKIDLEAVMDTEHFFASYKTLTEKGFMAVSGVWQAKKKPEGGEEAPSVGIKTSGKAGDATVTFTYKITTSEGEDEYTDTYNIHVKGYVFHFNANGATGTVEDISATIGVSGSANITLPDKK